MVSVLVLRRILIECWLAAGAAEVVAVTLVVAKQLGLGCLFDVNLVLWHYRTVEVLLLSVVLGIDGWNHHRAESKSYHEFLHNTSSIVTDSGKSFFFAHK